MWVTRHLISKGSKGSASCVKRASIYEFVLTCSVAIVLTPQKQKGAPESASVALVAMHAKRVYAVLAVFRYRTSVASTRCRGFRSSAIHSCAFSCWFERVPVATVRRLLTFVPFVRDQAGIG